MMDNNIVDISGTLITDLKLSHSVHGQNFYEAILANERTSGVVDEIPILISDKLILPEKYQALQVIGEFRSYNMVQENGKSKLLLHVLARHLFFLRKYRHVMKSIWTDLFVKSRRTEKHRLEDSFVTLCWLSTEEIISPIIYPALHGGEMQSIARICR